MKSNLYYYSHIILQSQLKWLFSIIIFLTIYYVFNFNYIENMGNCCSTSGAIEPESPAITVREAYTLEALQAERKFYNNRITALNQELFELREEIRSLKSENARLSEAYKKSITDLYVAEEKLDKISEASPTETIKKKLNKNIYD